MAFGGVLVNSHAMRRPPVVWIMRESAPRPNAPFKPDIGQAPRQRCALSRRLQRCRLNYVS